MHHTSVVIWYTIVINMRCGVLVKGKAVIVHNVMIIDGDIAVTVWATLLMLKAHCMANLMHNDTFLEGKGEICRNLLFMPSGSCLSEPS